MYTTDDERSRGSSRSTASSETSCSYRPTSARRSRFHLAELTSPANVRAITVRLPPVAHDHLGSIIRQLSDTDES